MEKTQKDFLAESFDKSLETHENYWTNSLSDTRTPSDIVAVILYGIIDEIPTKKGDGNIRLNFKRLDAHKAEYKRLKLWICNKRLKLQKAEITKGNMANSKT